MSKWELYNMLKGNRIPTNDNDIINLINGMDIDELKEGIIEYLIMIKHDEYIIKQIKIK